MNTDFKKKRLHCQRAIAKKMVRHYSKCLEEIVLIKFNSALNEGLIARII